MRFGNQIMVPAYVRPEQKAALVALAKKRDVSVASLIREGIDLVLSKRGKENRRGHG